MSNPCSYRIQVLQARKHAWDLGKLEVFYKKTILLTPYFHCFNISLELKGDTGEKNEKIPLKTRKFILEESFLFATFAKNLLCRIFFKIIVNFPFLMAKFVAQDHCCYGYIRFCIF